MSLRLTANPLNQIEEVERQLYKLAESGRNDTGFQRFGQALAAAHHPKLGLAIRLPVMTKTRKAFLAREQFLHDALFQLPFSSEELVQRLDEGICIAQRLGDGFLFGFGGREGDTEFL
jgi:hypothetical protein